MAMLDFILGRHLASDEDKDERVGPLAGVSVFGLDALSSAAYGPEAALTVLIPLGIAGVGFSLPITIAVSVILTIVYFSYRQTISGYPEGAGSYTVAKENLGAYAGLFAAAALMIDYTLNVAVGISAGIGALTSALPPLQPYALLLCLAVLLLLAFFNLRGLRESGLAFMPPTYLFIGCLVLVLVIGIVKAFVSGGHPQPVNPLPPPSNAHQQITLWLFLKAFAAGCTAMTGVEAVSNGVQAFKEPVVDSARRTLTLIVAILILLLLGIAYLVSAYQITATDPGSPGYQSILSLLTEAIVGRGVFYYVTIASILLVLCLSANTSFADFPRVCRTVSQDGFLPLAFAVRGRRLVYTQGIIVLTVLAGSLLILFNGVTDKLIPLFAVGAFLAFTLSQAGMVIHWSRSKERNARLSAVINGIGAVATTITFLIVIVTKFAEGAWLVVIVLPMLFILMLAISRHYARIGREVAVSGPVRLERPREMIAVVPIDHLNVLAERALQVAYGLSQNIHVLHIQEEQSDRDFSSEWRLDVQPSIDRTGLWGPKLVILKSPYRKVITPILNYIWKLEGENPENVIAVLVPELVESRWYYSFLHNRRAAILKTVLLLKGRNRILIVNVPWNLEKELPTKVADRRELRDRFRA
ncbi:MAG TPA: APC family permease [Chthoniobacterales bacterium]|jgi:amino acid transporter|nr:APC family permease [Chthoniobacterales bacterium]